MSTAPPSPVSSSDKSAPESPGLPQTAVPSTTDGASAQAKNEPRALKVAKTEENLPSTTDGASAKAKNEPRALKAAKTEENLEPQGDGGGPTGQPGRGPKPLRREYARYF
ncbi:hypothetical protein B0H17DRAFT_1193044 [Mycena rosella]|uniref:Uncharacterized protein n=1 Tax=Mycena rosella TaxID=1033263 RepID=A0AAD7GU97_MYCRO|nr:hypothetical protein B0H17DRAFT_1193044 [Mycena rosella]